MMRRSLVLIATACSLVCIATDVAYAQGRSTGRVGAGRSSYRNTLSRPAVSPYLNLLRPDASPAQNYYNLVRPQIDQRDATLQQGSEIDALRRDVNTARGSRGTGGGRMSPTGHHAEFMSHSHFYRGLGGAAPAGRTR